SRKPNVGANSNPKIPSIAIECPSTEPLGKLGKDDVARMCQCISQRTRSKGSVIGDRASIRKAEHTTTAIEQLIRRCTVLGQCSSSDDCLERRTWLVHVADGSQADTIAAGALGVRQCWLLCTRDDFPRLGSQHQDDSCCCTRC